MTEEDVDRKMTKAMLDLAQTYANAHSTCSKVQVGSCISSGYSTICGCNHGISNCKKNGCRRIQLYGEASKDHRLPSDCDSIHSEIDAICEAAKSGIRLLGSTIYVTRYPCENCARAIATSGIKKVVYGRKQSISPYTAMILAMSHVDVVHDMSWDWEDNNE